MKSFILPKEFGKEWLEALRSGNYKQGTGELLNLEYDYDKENDEEDQDSPIKDTFCYCCLGVAAKISNADWKYLARRELMSCDEKYFIELGVPSCLVEDSSGKTRYTIVDVLTSLNDCFEKQYYDKSLKAFPNLKFRKKLDFEKQKQYRFSFEEIADFIEDNTKFI